MSTRGNALLLLGWVVVSVLGLGVGIYGVMHDISWQKIGGHLVMFLAGQRIEALLRCRES